MPIRSRLTAACAAAFALLAMAAPASAFEPPELFVRTAAGEQAPPGPWIPLASAPEINYMGGWEIGYRIQASGQPNELHARALTVTAVPDGAPHSQSSQPVCSTRSGQVGEIVGFGSPVLYEGNGSYAVTVFVGPDERQRGACMSSGASSTATFSTNVRVTPEVVGTPMTVRSVPLPEGTFSGVRAPDVPGGLGDVQCALEAIVQPDGSLRGRELVEKGGSYDSTAEIGERELFPPGNWTCVARGIVAGTYDPDNPPPDASYPPNLTTPWSPPRRLKVEADLQRVKTRLTGDLTLRPLFTFEVGFPHAAAGGRAKLKLVRYRCRRGKPVVKPITGGRGKFDARGRVKVSFPIPKAEGYYVGALSISGGRFYRDGTDRTPIVFYRESRERHGQMRVLRNPPC